MQGRRISITGIENSIPKLTDTIVLRIRRQLDLPGAKLVKSVLQQQADGLTPQSLIPIAPIPDVDTKLVDSIRLWFQEVLNIEVLVCLRRAGIEPRQFFITKVFVLPGDISAPNGPQHDAASLQNRHIHEAETTNHKCRAGFVRRVDT